MKMQGESSRHLQAKKLCLAITAVKSVGSRRAGETRAAQVRERLAARVSPALQFLTPNLKAACLTTTLGIALTSPLITSANAAEPNTAKPKKAKAAMADILKNSAASDWRPLDIKNTFYLELEKGRVVIELAPEFAPENVANIKALVGESYFDGLAMLRSHDNYVAQWGDPDDESDKRRVIKSAKQKVTGEFSIKYDKNFAFTRLPDVDGYAPQVGHTNSFAAGRDPKSHTTWLAHCYGAVGVARGNETDSGNGSSLYVITGHAPRHLDRNITVVGRVRQGIELLSSLPRGTGALGFYEKAEERTPIKTIRMAIDVPEAERSNLEVLRTDTQTFQAVVAAQRNRSGDWYKFAANHIELCNVPIPVRGGK